MKLFRRGVLSLVFLMGTLLFSGCSRKKTTTVSDSTIPRTTTTKESIKLSALAEEDLLPAGMQGTKQIAFSGVSVNVQDDGLREVFVDDGMSGALASEVFSRLTTPSDPTNKLQLSLKQATVSVGGSLLTVPGGVELLPHLSGYNVSFSASGNDLLIQPDLSRVPYESYVLIDATLEDNYLITNPRDRFGPSIYMIPQKDASLLKFTRGSDLQGVVLAYHSGDTQIQLGYGYEDRWSGFFTMSDEVLVPGKTSVHLSSTLPSAQAKVYHVVFDEEKTSADTVLKTISYPLAHDHLANYLTQKKFGIRSLDEVALSKSGDWQIVTTEAKEQALFVVEPSFSYLLPIHNYPFLVELQKDASDEYRPYYSRLLTSYLLDESVLKKSLEDFFGEKNVTYQSWDKGFSYQIQPTTTYSGTILVQNIYGQQVEVEASYLIEKIKPQAITQEIVSNNTISVLPRSGVFKDVLIQYKNIASFPVSFQACSINATPDVLSDYKGVGVENYLFACSGSIVTQEIRPDEQESFLYRKAYRTPLSIPETLSGAQAFKVFFKDQRGQEQSHYMLKSDIGLWTKIANDQLRVWGFMFTDGQPLQDGEVKVSNLEGMTLGTATIKDGLAKVSLPKLQDSYDYATQRKKDTYLVQLTTKEEKSFVIAHRSGWGDLSVPAKSPTGSERYLKINSKLDISEIVSSSTQINQRGMIDPIKIYGYTDRGLYKAGDTINIAGRVRNVLRFDNLDYLKGLTVSVTISNPLGGEPILLDELPLDTFGGFAGSYTLPSTVPLGDWIITYSVSDNSAYYSHNIKVEEYQKPTFFVDITHQTIDDVVTLVMKPSYFFGAPLQKYDIQVNWSLVGKDICRYCRRWNENDYYFNHVFNDSLSTGGNVTLYNQTAETLTQSLYPTSLQVQKGYQYTLKADLIVKDRLSDETQFFTKYIDFKPEVMVGLAGQPYERLYRDKKGTDPRKTRKIDGVIQEGKEKAASLTYEIYTWNYDTQLQQGVDGNAYYVNGQSYLPVTSGSLEVVSNFNLPMGRIDAPGEYFVRVFVQDADGETIGEVQKRLSWYVSSDEQDDMLGAVPNNYTLSVDIPKKTYNEGESIPLNIVPYQRDAWVVVTVERGQYIIDSFLKKLDGTQLSVPVKKGYAPNVLINVMMLQGTQLNNSVRQEPRFFAGYAEATIDTALQELHISLRTDKQDYLPGDPVTIAIVTTDSKGKLVDARVSVAVVDEALTSLYTLLKEPLPYFFNKVGTSIFTYTNMKLLYQSLKAFATGGSKGGGGNGGKAMFSYIRDDLKDAAFWSGAVYTKGGRAEVTFTAPENLTTWLIDTIGITTDTRLGTASTGFVVKKDLIIEPNAPLFVTLGDQLTVPVKVVVPDKQTSGKVTGSVRMINQQGERVDLGNYSVDPNSTVGVELTIPKTWWTSAYIDLYVQGSYGSATDGIKKTIPLRSEGLISRDSVGTINKAGLHTFTIPQSITSSTSIRLAQLPTNFIDPIATYLIRYPYGCTEQLLSSLLPLLSLHNLRTAGIFASPLLSGSTVITDQGPIDIETALRDGVAKLLMHQRQDGGFGYWARDGGSEVTKEIYILSAYVYSALQELGIDRTLEPLLVGPIARLETFLVTNKTLSREGRYWYILSKVKAGLDLTTEEQQSLSNIKTNEGGYLPLIRYLIAVAQQDTAAIKTRRLVATIPTNESQWNETSIFFNTITATALKLSALIDDPEATQQERSDLFLSLLKQREKTGLRGWSTQANLQVIKTLSKLSTFWKPKAMVACTVKVDGKEYPVTVTTGTEGVDLPLSGTTTTIDWACDSPLLADVVVSYMPVDLETSLGVAQHVSDMHRSISNPSAKVGDTVDIVGSFATDLAGEQVAVELFVPSEYKLLEVISSKMPTQNDNGYVSEQLPFIVSDAHCLPTHRETRFDRLFLYYDVLQPGVCDITIPALKAYNGMTTIMPMRVWEMYKGLLNGRKVIVR